MMNENESNEVIVKNHTYVTEELYTTVELWLGRKVSSIWTIYFLCGILGIVIGFLRIIGDSDDVYLTIMFFTLGCAFMALSVAGKKKTKKNIKRLYATRLAASGGSLDMQYEFSENSFRAVTATTTQECRYETINRIDETDGIYYIMIGEKKASLAFFVEKSGFETDADREAFVSLLVRKTSGKEWKKHCKKK